MATFLGEAFKMLVTLAFGVGLAATLGPLLPY